MPIAVGSPPPLPSNLLYSGTGALNQAVDFSGDDVNGYLIILAGTAGTTKIEFNTDTTATNYYKQTALGQGSSAGAANANNNTIENAGGSYCHGYIYVLLDATNKRIHAVGSLIMNATSSMKMVTFGLYNTTQLTDITNINIDTFSGSWWIYGVKN